MLFLLFRSNSYPIIQVSKTGYLILADYSL